MGWVRHNVELGWFLEINVSKQSKAKEFQMYVDKCIPMVCGNCTSFKSDKVQTCEPTSWMPEGWWSEKNMRCSIGGFAVKKTGTCNLHTFLPPNAELTGARSASERGTSDVE